MHRFPLTWRLCPFFWPQPLASLFHQLNPRPGLHPAPCRLQLTGPFTLKLAYTLASALLVCFKHLTSSCAGDLPCSFQLTGPLVFKALGWHNLASALLAALDVQQAPGLQDRVGGFVGECTRGAHCLLLLPLGACPDCLGVLLLPLQQQRHHTPCFKARLLPRAVQLVGPPAASNLEWFSALTSLLLLQPRLPGCQLPGRTGRPAVAS